MRVSLPRRLPPLTIRAISMLVMGAFSLMMITVGLLGGYALQVSQDAFDTLDRLNAERTAVLEDVYVDTLRAQLAMNRAASLIERPSFDAPGPVIEQAEALMGQAKEAFERLAPTASSPALDTLGQRFQSLLDTGMSLQLIQLKEANARLAAGDDAARDLSGYRSGQSRLNGMNAAFMKSADAFMAASQQRGATLVNDVGVMADGLRMLIGAAILASLIAIALVMWGVTRRVVTPLNGLREHFDHIAEGRLDHPVVARGQRDIRRLFEALDGMRQRLAANVGAVRTSSQTIHDDTQRIAADSQALASRTDRQAAALEETAASMAQLTATVGRNAEHAEQAVTLAATASQSAERGQEAVAQVTTSMESIRAGSRQVEDIVAMIDSLAFQTNLLALNASVEAARAGQHGRGFSVVANEVRRLASQSAEAARDIRTLTDNARRDVEVGSQRVQQTGATIGELVASVEQTAQLMRDIADASQEQHQGIAQIDRAIEQLEQLTQGNAAMATQATQAATQLGAETTRLHASVSEFVLDADDAPVSHVPAIRETDTPPGRQDTAAPALAAAT
ncbi:methyl-accepting chemotaxis sensory transducer with TarH sensor [Chromohalobacter marismortui]|uniref:Methyl-accepting chemotaxis sensory transducer with TarH sensor n=1 Tax=Chromohalobacter marismortui TaxID=42055 RepID=A0A4R7NUT8_9GAMM|nr:MULTISPECIES: methyl-accepting chemotaxis protein [Chromohalobacter]MCI0510510.1 methyl-accepting chemotaxis protein [Chromohalobacter sp.]MCI0594137.1 methyl-accepting chemotaxis protein [Chromohalobacter sp.]TDU24914.1 methyl-accepting chemotaxis sensory transducer with TarH sensor [Chromohalobacter marismortui]